VREAARRAGTSATAELVARGSGYAERMWRVFAVIKEKLYVTGSRHFYVIISVALSTPLLITTLIVALILVHRHRWMKWRKHALAKEALSAIHAHRQQSEVVQQSLQPDDALWELDPAM